MKVSMFKETKKQSIIIKMFVWLLIFPAIFQRIKETFVFLNDFKEKTVEELNRNYQQLIRNKVYAVEEFNKINNNIKQINEDGENRHKSVMAIWDEVVKKPYHNCTFLYDLRNQATNLNTFRNLCFEIEFQPQVNDTGVLIFKLIGDKKEIDRVQLDVTKFNEDHPDKPIFDYGRVMLRKRTLNRDQVALACLSSLIQAMKIREGLIHSNLANICVHAYLEVIRDYYEAEQPKKELNVVENENGKDTAEDKEPVIIDLTERTNERSHF